MKIKSRCTILFSMIILSMASSNAFLEKGMVLITFDDGYINQYTSGAKILQIYNYPATAFICGKWIGKPGYMSINQLRDLQDNHNWDIANHTYSHPHIRSEQQFVYEVTKQRDFLISNGFKGYKFFAYSYGEYNTYTVDISKRYFSLARTINFDDKSPFQVPFENQYKLKAKYVQKDTSLQDLTHLVDIADSNTGVLILVFHEIIENPKKQQQWSRKDFIGLMQYLSKKNIEVITFSQLMQKIGYGNERGT
jgi:peptidoglycan/xylan/chitin deacetylase (PgdA/CDA1 family)